MIEARTTQQSWNDGGKPVFRGSLLLDVTDAEKALCRYFQDRCAIFLDGALPCGSKQGRLIRQAHESLANGKICPNHLPAAVLRETLDDIVALPRPAAKAGLVAVGPKHARVWWDQAVLDNLDDVLARLDSPRPLLRFYDVTGLDPESGRWNEIIDMDVSLKERGRTVELVNSDRAYVVDLGYAYADGRFLRLARTNLADLPRNAAGSGDSSRVARSGLRAESRRNDEAAVPDARAREWAEGRQDQMDRDIESELVVHMLYRAFLREGPRALRRAPRIFRKDADTLRREYAQRSRTAKKRAAKPADRTAPTLLAVRLDRHDAAPAAALLHPPVLARAAASAAGSAAPVVEQFGWHEELATAARVKRVHTVRALPDAHGSAGVAARKIADFSGSDLVKQYADADRLEPVVAAPVFLAAENLRKNLAGLRMPEQIADTLPSIAANRLENIDGAPANRLFGGSEAKRMAKAGVRVTRMALTLEGRMRPGARLKVAGKLVHADANGNFRLECVLTGRKASIPMRAGTSIGGEVRSLVNVEWEKRASREKKKVFEKGALGVD